MLVIELQFEQTKLNKELEKQCEFQITLLFIFVCV